MFQALPTAFLWLALASWVNSDVENQSAFAHPPPFPQDGPSDAVITPMRTDCYGGCPTYTLTINADRKVLYNGGRDVKQNGKVESRISQEKLKELIAAFKEINYFDLQSRYDFGSEACPGYSHDMPSAMTSLTLNKKKKTVNHSYGCSGSKELGNLTWLEKKIDDAVNVDQWIK